MGKRGTLIIKFDVDCDPTLVDPHEVADEILDAYQREGKAGNNTYEVAEAFLEAEWEE